MLQALERILLGFPSLFLACYEKNIYCYSSQIITDIVSRLLLNGSKEAIRPSPKNVFMVSTLNGWKEADINGLIQREYISISSRIIFKASNYYVSTIMVCDFKQLVLYNYM